MLLACTVTSNNGRWWVQVSVPPRLSFQPEAKRYDEKSGPYATNHSGLIPPEMIPSSSFGVGYAPPFPRPSGHSNARSTVQQASDKSQQVA